MRSTVPPPLQLFSCSFSQNSTLRHPSRSLPQAHVQFSPLRLSKQRPPIIPCASDSPTLCDLISEESWWTNPLTRMSPTTTAAHRCYSLEWWRKRLGRLTYNDTGSVRMTRSSIFDAHYMSTALFNSDSLHAVDLKPICRPSQSQPLPTVSSRETGKTSDVRQSTELSQYWIIKLALDL